MQGHICMTLTKDRRKDNARESPNRSDNSLTMQSAHTDLLKVNASHVSPSFEHVCRQAFIIFHGIERS